MLQTQEGPGCSCHLVAKEEGKMNNQMKEGMKGSIEGRGMEESNNWERVDMVAHTNTSQQRFMSCELL